MIFSIGLVVSTTFSWKAEERQIGITESLVVATQNFAKAALKSANAAQQSADFLRNAERAYAFLDGDEMIRQNPLIPTDGIVAYGPITTVFRNFGKTPAMVDGLRVVCGHWPDDRLPSLSARDRTIPPGIMIGSNAPWTFDVRVNATIGGIDNAQSGRGGICLYGEIACLDMLEKRHVSGFC